MSSSISINTSDPGQIDGVIQKGNESLGSSANPDVSTGDSVQNVDLENPDGVHVNRAENENALKSDVDNTDGETAGKSNTTSVDNTAVNNQDVYYVDDVDSISYPVDGKNISVGKKPTSVFNKYSLVDFRGEPTNMQGGMSGKSQFYNKIDPVTLQNPTATKIIEITNNHPNNVGYRYDYSDFALLKYFGRIPNNMMITLRRFAFPVPDDIVSPKSIDKTGKEIEIPQPDIARAITFLGEQTGNNLADILKFSHGFNWKDAEAQVQPLQSQKAGRSGIVGQTINSNTFLSAAANAAQGRDAYDSAVRRANAGYDAFSNTYPNHVFGPLNVIKQVLVREQGLTFEQEFTLKFEYNLKSLDGANPKILMLDQLANVLALTYNNAPFWGGDVRYIGDGSVAKPLGDINLIREGNYGEFLKSVVNDIGLSTDSFSDFASSAKNLFNGAKGKFLNNIVGGDLLKLFNSPQGGQAVASLLTGDPTGQWHLTVGNPLNPIMVLGNLACTGTEINFEGPMGIQDFPEKMVVTVTLKPGRPRDKAEIESMFNAGRGRFYVQPADAPDINQTKDVSAYGNADRQNDKYFNEFKKISLG